MPKASHRKLFDSKTEETLLYAAEIKRSTPEEERLAQSFLDGLHQAVELYRKLFPDGRPSAGREVLVLRELMGRAPESSATSRATLAYRWAVVRAEKGTFTRIGQISSQLVTRLAALSHDADALLADQLFLEFSHRFEVGEVVKVVAALKAACDEFSQANTMRTPRTHRHDVQLLVDSVVDIFAEHYTGAEKKRRHYRAVEEKKRLAKARSHTRASFRKACSEARASFWQDLKIVLDECVRVAGVDAKLNVVGERAWHNYVLPSLKNLAKRRHPRSLWWLFSKPAGGRRATKSQGRPSFNDALPET